MPNYLEDPMPNDLPTACSLRATKVLARLVESSALGEGAPWVVVETSPPHAALRFRAKGDTYNLLADIVTTESECCAFLEVTRVEPQVVELSIATPPGAKLVLDSLAAAFAGQAEAA